MIACVLLPDFAAAVERRAAPSLAGIPLVIAGGSAGSGQVLAVSGEAAGLGVKPGMSLRQARALCPQAPVIPADPARYQRASETLLEVLGSFTPFVEPGGQEPVAIAYLDLGRMAQAETLDLARRIGQAVQEAVGLMPRIGLARGKFPAYVAAFRPGRTRRCWSPPVARRTSWLLSRWIRCHWIKRWRAACNCWASAPWAS